VPASLKKLAFDWLNRSNSLLRSSNKNDSLRQSLLFFGSPVKVDLRVVEAVAFENLRQRTLLVAEALEATSFLAHQPRSVCGLLVILQQFTNRYSFFTLRS
jgi:hypothetical protein